MTKTGEVYHRDEAGVLWLSESFEDDDGNVVTTDTQQPDGEQPALPAANPEE